MHLPPDGFLSPELDAWRETQLSAPGWFALVADINRHSVALLPTLRPSNTSDRELGTAALFGATLQTFEATIILAKRGMLADAGSLARNIVENAIFLGGLALIKDFPQRMAASSNAHYFKMGNAIADLEGNGLDDAGDADGLRELLRDVKEQGHPISEINLRKLAKEIDRESLYEVAYRALSGDFAHPSLTSIERHFLRGDRRQIEKIIFSPQFKGVEKILGAAIYAFLAALEALGVVFPSADIARMFEIFNVRHHSLSSAAAGKSL